MVRILTGPESYLIDRVLDEAKKAIENPEVNYIRTEEFNTYVNDFLNSYPFLGDKKMAAVYVNSIKDLENNYFSNYISNPVDYADLYVVVKKLDLRTKAAKKFKKLLVVYSHVEENELIKIIGHELSIRKCSMNKDALAEFIRRENYLDNDEVDLYDIVADINDLCLITNVIDVATVCSNIKNKEVSNAFSIAKCILLKNTKELRHQCNLISNTDVIPTMCLLLREYRIAYKSLYYDNTTIGAKYINLKGMTKEEVIDGLRIINNYIKLTKQGIFDASIALFMLANSLVENRR